jgi:hypothetical protein
VKRASRATEKPLVAGKVGDRTKPRSHGLPNGSRVELSSEPDLKADEMTTDQATADQAEITRIKELPKEVGVMLITAGIVGVILPGPGTPAIIAGGLALWPKAFGKLEAWLERNYPEVHRRSMYQIGRFLNDLENRYPYSDGLQSENPSHF